MKGFLLEFYIDQNAEHKETSFEAALMPEVTFLQILWWALFGLFFFLSNSFFTPKTCAPAALTGH